MLWEHYQEALYCLYLVVGGVVQRQLYVMVPGLPFGKEMSLCFQDKGNMETPDCVSKHSFLCSPLHGCFSHEWCILTVLKGELEDQRLLCVMMGVLEFHSCFWLFRVSQLWFPISSSPLFQRVFMRLFLNHFHLMGKQERISAPFECLWFISSICHWWQTVLLTFGIWLSILLTRQRHALFSPEATSGSLISSQAGLAKTCFATILFPYHLVLFFCSVCAWEMHAAFSRADLLAVRSRDLHSQLLASVCEGPPNRGHGFNTNDLYIWGQSAFFSPN